MIVHRHANLADRHGAGCGCVPSGLTRRGALRFGLALTAIGAAGTARAASGNYETMLLNCIDPRFVTGSVQYMGRQGLQEKYSHFVIAGGPIGVVSPKFATWHAAFWDNLAVSMQLHSINRIIGLTHRDCGAAKIALGEPAVANLDAETKSHAEMLVLFRQEVAKRQPKLTAVTGIMALDGSVLLIDDKGLPTPG
jgi:hypothetical protein